MLSHNILISKSSLSSHIKIPDCSAAYDVHSGKRFQTNNCQILCPFPGAALSTDETAGLLTYPDFIAPSRPCSQWQDATSLCTWICYERSMSWELQQRVLSRLLTSFPFMPCLTQDNHFSHKVTNSFAHLKNYLYLCIIIISK